LHAFLDDLDEDTRAVFIMAALEQVSAPEIAEALDLNLNPCMRGFARRGASSSAQSKRSRARSRVERS
jgi:RNA polymerase sigma-70 factor (ECF subfamily)